MATMTFGENHFSYLKVGRYNSQRFFSLDYHTIGAVNCSAIDNQNWVTLQTSFGKIEFAVWHDDTMAFHNGPLRIDPSKSAFAPSVAEELIARIEAWKTVPPMVAPGYFTPSFSWESE